MAQQVLDRRPWPHSDDAALHPDPSLAGLSWWGGIQPDVQLILGPYRPHTLLVGSREGTDAVLGVLRSRFIPTVRLFDCAMGAGRPGMLDMVDVLFRARTIILRNVDALDGCGQRALMARLDAPDPRLQIISIASQPPFELVQRGRFLDGLYRRLSVVHLWLDS